MLPRALVLSADEKVSGLLQQALATADCEACVCKDIFSAIEQVTRESFCLLLINWQEELEADFLLNTARDLNFNRAASAVAVVTPAQERRALGRGADAVLVKPFTIQEAAGVLIPRLGIERRAADPNSTQSGLTCLPSAAPEPLGEAGQKLETNVELGTDIPGRVPQEEKCARAHLLPRLVLVPKDPGRSKFSRIASLVAIVWPLVITAALLAFDHWADLQRYSLSGLSAIFATAHARVSALPNQEEKNPRTTNDGSRYSTRAPITDDLLSDYQTPVLRSPASYTQGPAPETTDDIDLASLEALPPSTRSTSWLFAVEQPRVNPEIPDSLRFPPPAQSAIAVSPRGSLVAPDWPREASGIVLPEAVSRAWIEHEIAPVYPEEASHAGVDGTVVLQASIARDGTIRDLKVISGYLVLARAAFAAVKQWRYKPYQRNGQSVDVETLITVDFKRPPRG